MSRPLLGRAGVIGDVHGEDARLEAALDHLAGLGVSVVLCTGDVPDGGRSPSRCYELLRARGVITIRGNHDRWLLDGTMRSLPDATFIDELSPVAREYLASLEPVREFDTPHGGLLLCHGLGKHDMARVRPDDEGYALEVNDELHALIRDPRYAFVVNGHTHLGMVRAFEGLTVINAGSLRGNKEPPGFLLLDIGERTVDFFRIAEPDGPDEPDEPGALRIASPTRISLSP